MNNRGKSRREPSYMEESVTPAARNVYSTFRAFRSAGFTRRESVEFAQIFFEYFLSHTPRDKD